VVPLDRKPGGDDFQRGENNCAQERDDEECDELDVDLVHAGYAQIGEFWDKELPDKPKEKIEVCDIGNVGDEETRREIEDPRSPALSGS